MLPPLKRELLPLSAHLRSTLRSDDTVLAFINTVKCGTRDEIEAFYAQHPDHKDRFDTVRQVYSDYIKHLERYNTRLQMVLVTALRYLNKSSKGKLTNVDRARLTRDRRILRRMGVNLGSTKEKA